MIKIEDIHDFNNVKTVSIETLDWCNRKCGWCPNKDREQTGTQIDKDVFSKIVKELSELGYKGEIHPYFRNEPLCDPEITTFIATARRELPDNYIRLNTNGDYLKFQGDIEDLIEAGVSAIHISHYDKHENIGKVADKFYPIITHFGRDTLFESFYNRGGNVDVESKKKFERCPWIFQKIMIASNGNVVLCCSDFHEEVVLGNVKNQTVKEIWDSERFRKYREYHAGKKGRELLLCDRCNFII